MENYIYKLIYNYSMMLSLYYKMIIFINQMCYLIIILLPNLYYYNDFFGTENLYCEYKEFTLNNHFIWKMNNLINNIDGIFKQSLKIIQNLLNEAYQNDKLNKLSLDLAEYYCRTNLFKFNNYVIVNLKLYLSFYVPKYISGFLNSNIDGHFYIGVNDLGFIKGIPFSGDIPSKYLIQEMYKLINIFIKDTINDLKLDDIINIEFIKVNCLNLPINKKHYKFIEYLNSKNIYNNQYKYNKFIYNKWKKNMILYHKN